MSKKASLPAKVRFNFLPSFKGKGKNVVENGFCMFVRCVCVASKRLPVFYPTKKKMSWK